MAASTLFDRIKVSTATVGTGDIVVGVAQPTFISFVEGGVEEGDQISYLIEDNLGWEIGTGIYTASTGSFTRTVQQSSNADAAISLSGSAIVSLTALASDLATLDNPQTLTSKTLASAAITGSTVDSTTVGATTPASGAFTTLAASGAVSGTGFSDYLAAPPAIGGTTPAAITGTTITGSTITANSAFAGPHNGTVGATTPNSGAFTTLSANSTVSGTGFITYLASPPAIGGNTPAAITGTTITANTGLVGPHNGTVGATTPASGAFTTLTANSNATFTGGVGKNAFGSVQNQSFLAINGDSTVLQQYGVYLAPTLRAACTVWRGHFVQASTAAEASTISSYVNYVSTFGTLGAGSAITTLYGYTADAELGTSGAGTVYGYFSNIASAANKWNFFANGNANNAFAGNTRFGGLTAPVNTVDVTGNILATTSILTNGATDGIGYSAGAGGAVTQATSRTTGVTINKVSGRITLFSTTTTAGTFASFTVTNNAVDATDVVIVNIGSGATANSYSVTVSAVAAGSFRVQIANAAAVAVAEAPILNFAVIKAVAA